MNCAKILILGLLLVAGPSRADEEQQLIAEASSLFRVVIAAEAPPARCEYGLAWSPTPVPEYVASKYFGLTLHADVSAPQQNTDFQDTLDPRKQHADAFCSRAESAAFEKAQFDAFEKNRSAKRVVVESVSFTLPIFNSDYTTAIVIIGRSALQRDRMFVQSGPIKPGGILRYPGNGVELANVYRKTNGDWHLLESVVIGQS